MQQFALTYKQPLAPALVAPGDECGQLISNLALALLACHLQKSAMMRSYIKQAHANVIRLSSQDRTIRAAGPTKMVRLASEGFGSSETLLLPILDEVLLLPSIELQEVARVLRTSFPQRPIIKFTDVSITYNRLRLRTDRLRHALAALVDTGGSPASGTLIQEILVQCLQPALPCADALSQADDYLTLALNFGRLNNYPLAAIALAKAEQALRAGAAQADAHAQSARMETARANIAALEQRLAAIAS